MRRFAKFRVAAASSFLGLVLALTGGCDVVDVVLLADAVLEEIR